MKPTTITPAFRFRRSTRIEQPSRFAFTLIEVLVVVSIIALLVAILLPSLAGARKQANTTVCGANLRSIGQGILIYIDDHKGVLPSYTQESRVDPTVSVFQNNQFYLYGDYVNGSGADKGRRPVNKYIHGKSGVYHCPLDAQNPVYAAAIGHEYKDTYQRWGNSYPYNVALGSVYYSGPGYGLEANCLPVLYQKRIEQIRGASRIVMAGDITSVYPQHWTYNKTAPWYASFFTHDRKKPKCNLLFMDGHVAPAMMRDPPGHIVNGDYSMVLIGTPPAWYGGTSP